MHDPADAQNQHAIQHIPRCCCQSSDCAFLAHSCKLLRETERNAQTAAELGQALLARHESYVADVERDRRQLLMKMEALEHEKHDLEAKNANMIRENRKLLEHLELLNAAAVDSESSVQALTGALRATELEVARLNGLASRVEMLQSQLARLEEEEALLHSSLEMTRDEERAAVSKWQQAERTIYNLQCQLDQIEREASDERTNHEEIVERMRRRHAVELELESAADRLKSAARSRTLPAESGGNVVSHFVKDILQDNANLQLGILELREMLNRSNDEVETLRQEMFDGPEGQRSPVTQPTNLNVELGAKELHVHHHYHAPARGDASSSRQTARRPRKKRTSLTSGHFVAPSGSHTPRPSVSITRPQSSMSINTILSETSASLPHRPHRWSMQSNQTGFTSSSSLPSSPRTESIFDRAFGDSGTDFSRPTSPESNATMSPRILGHAQRDSVPRLYLDGGSRSASGSSVVMAQPSGARSSKGKGPWREPSSLDQDLWQAGHSTILEENEDLEASLHSSRHSDEHDHDPQAFIPSLRRTASHESLISISGMDIHTLQSRPSQRFVGQRLYVNPAAPSTGTSLASLSDANATAILPSALSRRSGSSYLSNLAANQRRQSGGLQKRQSFGQLGQIVGGWVWNKWGHSAAPRLQDDEGSSTPGSDATVGGRLARSIASGSSIMEEDEEGPATSRHAASKAQAPAPSPFKLRSPGVNQPGPIFGFLPPPPAPSQVQATVLNEDALRESLAEGPSAA
ncbi:hypothetical protein EJ06DRAFT_548127 [Trichodelitschia bisporula]|uniref:Uncharacterized protein n=1 Tax=Trichodelitschia bisporula TaxID=703511 RepID=A0A6G1I0U3_9PEZI|nr:hypothetical protein EJ06DRAFT_548127 [Trichodelitschia bisporula]